MRKSGFKFINRFISRWLKNNPAKLDHYEIAIPPELECHVYRQLHEDLARLNDNQLLEHYSRCGKSEGRVSNRLVNRRQFASLVTPKMRALEIGPFAAPLLQGDNVSYCDVLDQESLKRRARDIG